ncbi:MAG TPA: hypothetical protein VFA74_14450 [Terriglobales bacterium]|nr:hypothetical protein [Terriglobales bacterium]
MLENNCIAPKFFIELSREALKQGRDTQLGTAIDVAKALRSRNISRENVIIRVPGLCSSFTATTWKRHNFGNSTRA